METGKWELGISIFYFLFPVSLSDLMLWHLGIWISFGIWILKFGFFRQNLKMTNDKAQMSNQAQNPNDKISK